MANLIGLVQDYKSNVPLEMLENKYKIPIHEIIKVLYAVTIKEKGVEDETKQLLQCKHIGKQ